MHVTFDAQHLIFNCFIRFQNITSINSCTKFLEFLIDNSYSICFSNPNFTSTFCFTQCQKHYCEKHKNAICKNFPGKYQCVCKHGFHGNFKQCKDLDECSSRKHQCSPHGNCINTIGSYTCKCKSGYQGDGLKCEDKVECKEPSVRINKQICK